MWRTVLRLAALVLPMCLQSPLISATLNVDFDIRTRATEGDGASARKHVAIFVLDRSGSMLWKPANNEPAANRNQLLRESVRERIRAIGANQPNADVYFLQFAGTIDPMQGPFSVKTEADVEKLCNWKGLDDDACGGLTLLYDAQARALDFADELFDREPTAKMMFFVYTDGANETPQSGSWTDRSQKDSGSWFATSKKVKVRYPSVSGGRNWERDAKEALRQFKSDYWGRVQSYVTDGKIEQYWGWLGAGNPPDDLIKKTKDEYVLTMSSPSPALKNPAAVPVQALPVTLAIPLPEKYASDLSGLSATAALAMNGRKVSGKVLSLKPGKCTISYQIPDKFPSGAFEGTLSISDLPDAWDRIALKRPHPLEISFAAPDSISFLSVEPKDGLYVRVGDTVRFSAKASDGADVGWTVGGKAERRESFDWKFTDAGDCTVTVKATKAGFVPATETIRIHVIDAAVDVRVVSARPTVGEAIDFVADARGVPESYAWWVDGQAVSARTKHCKGLVFDRSGKHTVKVRALYGHGLSADTDNHSFDVAVKPSVMITDPFSGSEFEFGEKIECKANVEGDFDKVVWTIAGPSVETQEAAVSKKDRVSKPVIFKPAKGGSYTLTAVAHGASGSLASKTVVKFRVARENLGVAIVSPSSGSSVELGIGAKATELKAAVKGEMIRHVKWTALNRKTGTKSDIRTTPVQDGTATCAFLPAASVGDGVTMVVQAEAILAAGEEPVASEPIELITSLSAELDIEATVDGKEANGREVRFGEQVDLRAICKGNVDPGKIQWFEEVGGKERELPGIGPKCTSPKELPSGENLRTVRYYAKAKLADGSYKVSRKVIVHHFCPDFSAAIRLPKGLDGITRTEFGIRDVINVEIDNPGAELTSVVWTLGQERAEGPVAKFGPLPKGEHTIAASGKCRNCGKAYALNPVKVKVGVFKPTAVLEYKDRESYTTGGNLHIDGSKSTNFPERWIWKVDGVEQPQFEGKSAIDVDLPKVPSEVTVELIVANSEGTSSALTKELRVRFGWWATVPAVVILLIVLYAFAKIFMGNGPRRWSFYTWEGPAPKQVGGGYPDELGDAYMSKGVELVGVKRWNYWTKKGKIKMGDMLMIDGDESNVWMPFSEDEFEVRCANDGTPIVRPPDGKFDDVTAEVNLTGESPYFLFRYIGLDYSDEIAKGHDNVRVRVLTEGGSGVLGGLLFLILLSAALYGFVWFCMAYAL